MSLKTKLLALTTSPSCYPTADQILDQEPLHVSDKESRPSTVTPWLWLHLQKNTPCKSATPLQSFMAAEPPPMIQFQSDDMLEHSWEDDEQDHTSRPGAVGPHGCGAPSDLQIINDNTGVRVACRGISFKQHILGELAIPDHISEDAEDDLLLQDERFKPLRSAMDSGNEVR